MTGVLDTKDADHARLQRKKHGETVQGGFCRDRGAERFAWFDPDLTSDDALGFESVMESTRRRPRQGRDGTNGMQSKVSRAGESWFM